MLQPSSSANRFRCRSTQPPLRRATGMLSRHPLFPDTLRVFRIVMPTEELFYRLISLTAALKNGRQRFPIRRNPLSRSGLLSRTASDYDEGRKNPGGPHALPPRLLNFPHKI